MTRVERKKVIIDATNKKDHIFGTGAHLPTEKRELPAPGRFFAAPSRVRALSPPRATACHINLFSTEQPRRASSVALAKPVAVGVQRPSCRRVCQRRGDSVVIEDASSSSAPRAATPPRTLATFLRFDGENSSPMRFGIRVSPSVRHDRGILPGDSQPATPRRLVSPHPQQCNVEKVLTGDPTAPVERHSAVRTSIKKNSPPSVDFRSSAATLRHPIATPQPSALFGYDKGRQGVCSWDYKFSAMYKPQGSYLLRPPSPASQRNRETQQEASRGIGKKRASSAPRGQLVLA